MFRRWLVSLHYWVSVQRYQREVAYWRRLAAQHPRAHLDYVAHGSRGYEAVFVNRVGWPVTLTRRSLDDLRELDV